MPFFFSRSVDYSNFYYFYESHGVKSGPADGVRWGGEREEVRMTMTYLAPSKQVSKAEEPEMIAK